MASSSSSAQAYPGGPSTSRQQTRRSTPTSRDYAPPPAPAGGRDPISEAAALIDARFHRAVDIIQSLPKSGPISTTYEEKLMLYSLYKQATEGAVTSSRPGLLDLLGRAKWDAWKKREKLTKPQAQEAYVETLLAILKGFSDRTQAVELIRELREFGQPKGTGKEREIADFASSSSSMRSLSPPPETSGSRRSYHSARHTAGSAGQDEEETPRRRQFPHQQASNARYRQPDTRYRQAEEDLPEDEYSDMEDEEEETDSETASEDARGQRRHSGELRRPREPLRQSGPSQQRFSGPSPYQHPAQYPAPVQTQLPHHLPSLPPSASAAGMSLQPSGSTSIPARRPAPRSAVPSVSTLPSYAQPIEPNQGLFSGSLQSGIQLQPISASTSALLPGPGNRSGPTQANLDRALDSIQTSLAALHERLNTIEHSPNLNHQATPSSSLRAYFTNSPILQLLGAVFSRLLVLLRLRAPSDGTRRNALSSLLGRALVSLLAGVRDLSRDAVAILFLAAAVASLRSTRGDWRAVIRAWARILAMASGVELAREGGLLAGLADQR